MSCYLYSFKGKGCVQMDDTDRKYPILHWILVSKHKMYALITSKIKLVEIEYGYEHVAVKKIAHWLSSKRQVKRSSPFFKSGGCIYKLPYLSLKSTNKKKESK